MTNRQAESRHPIAVSFQYPRPSTSGFASLGFRWCRRQHLESRQDRLGIGRGLNGDHNGVLRRFIADQIGVQRAEPDTLVEVFSNGAATSVHAPGSPSATESVVSATNSLEAAGSSVAHAVSDTVSSSAKVINTWRARRPMVGDVVDVVVCMIYSVCVVPTPDGLRSRVRAATPAQTDTFRRLFWGRRHRATVSVPSPCPAPASARRTHASPRTPAAAP